jgi:acetylornithine deacetylase/succinyl-diaminopimelate desuccinylase-like protein
MTARLPSSVLNAGIALDQVSAQWDGDIVRQISEYIAIPAKSPGFDSDWALNGFIDTVVRNAASWIEAQKVEGLTLEVVRLPGRTPVLFFEVPGTRAAVPGQTPQTVLMYGHLDKQPEFSGWRADLGPWTPS